MVNLEEIHHRLSEIREATKYLGDLDEAALDNRDKFLLGRYFLQMILEAVFTIGNQIISDANLRKPGSYKEILVILKENNIIDEKLYLGLFPLADLRNRLVHTYWKISKEELLEICKNLSLFSSFSQSVIKHIA